MTEAAVRPRFTVIVPTHDRLPSLRRTLAALEAQRYSTGEFEIVVCDDGSRDGTAEFLSTVGAPHCRVVRQPNRGAAAARNAGIAVARGAFLAFTDDDCVVPSDWLATLERLFTVTGADLIGGSAENELPSLLSQLYQDMARDLYEVRNRTSSHPTYVCTNNMACRREVIERIGPFDERFYVGGEDREFAARLQRSGGRIHVAPELCVRHAHAFSLGSFLHHFYRMGEGAYRLYQTVPAEPGNLRRPHPAMAYLAFVGRLLRRGPTPRALLRVGLFGLSQASAACGFCVLWLRGRRARAA